MKKLISASFISLSLSASAFAESISKEKYKELMMENRASYESVEPGMSYVGVGVNSVVTDENGNEFKCRQAIESTVIQVHGTQYLTHEKVKSLNDCAGSQTEEKVEEYLQWNKIYTIEEHLELLEARYVVESFNLKDSYIELKGQTKKFELSEARPYKRLTNISSSQFLNINFYNDGKFSWNQFYTRKIDPSTIKIEDLEVRDCLFE